MLPPHWCTYCLHFRTRINFFGDRKAGTKMASHSCRFDFHRMVQQTWEAPKEPNMYWNIHYREDAPLEQNAYCNLAANHFVV